MAKFKKDSKPFLFLELAKPNDKGLSRWVEKNEFVGKYSPLMFKNGADWCRKESSIAKYFYVEFDKNKTSGNGVDKIKLAGFKREKDQIGSQSIKKSIKDYYKDQRCVILGTSNIEVDHKNGWKNNDKVMDIKTQKINDFQPLSKAANDAKRQFCKECRRTNIRFDAKRLGYPMSYYYGDKKHNGSPTGCEGCFWYDPIEFRNYLKFSEESTKEINRKYQEETSKKDS